VSYTFASGIPRSLTEFASPNYTVDQLNPDLGLYVQDQWRINRVTVSAGLRFDWVRESVQATEVPAGVLVPARSFPARTDVPNWKDLNPRFGVVWDPTGSGKTAVKFGVNRYVQSNTTGVAQLFDQAAGAVNSTTRAWNDLTFPVGDPRRGNFLPDCNLVATTANGECGAMANPQFGTYVPVNSRYNHPFASAHSRFTRAQAGTRSCRRYPGHVGDDTRRHGCRKDGCFEQR
jgi:hypothetical protein